MAAALVLYPVRELAAPLLGPFDAISGTLAWVP
jgi:hypothetical protein